MSDPVAITSVDLNQIPVLVSAVGALGTAAMGVVETLGKGLLVFDPPIARRRQVPLGLPYAGYGYIKRLLKRVGPALEVTYGDNYAAMIAAQYRADRGAGQAPESIRQGVRLGLPYLSQAAAKDVIGAVWGLSDDLSDALAKSLTAEKAAGAAPAADVSVAQGLAARFATALDTSVATAFSTAEQIYQSQARFWAGVAAVALSLAYHLATAGPGMTVDPKNPAQTGWSGWVLALIVGLAAVPLAPVVKDLSSSLSQALSALGQIRGKPLTR